MWRRVSCEQPLNTSQSILRHRGNLNQACGVSTVKPQLGRKGGPHTPLAVKMGHVNFKFIRF